MTVRRRSTPDRCSGRLYRKNQRPALAIERVISSAAATMLRTATPLLLGIGASVHEPRPTVVQRTRYSAAPRKLRNALSAGRREVSVGFGKRPGRGRRHDYDDRPATADPCRLKEIQ
jgi:hypothetical protein